MSYVCQCANGKTWGAANSGCNDNASNCAQCCSGGYGGVAGSIVSPGTPYGFGGVAGSVVSPETPGTPETPYGLGAKGFVHPTQGPTDPGDPYIGKCYDIVSWAACGLSTSDDTVLKTLKDEMLDMIQMIYFPTVVLPQSILNSSPTGYTQAGYSPASTAVLHSERVDFLAEQTNNWGMAVSAAGGTFNIDFRYNGCEALNGVMNGWPLSNDNWILERAQTPGHVPLNTGNIANTEVFSSAAGGSNLHYQWWLLDAKINWAKAMIECCDCNALGSTGGMPYTQPKLSAPEGYHYMPDGTLMFGDVHTEFPKNRVIKDFKLNLDDISADGEDRVFTITGEEGAMFSLEIKNEDGYYYNFQTGLFQATKTGLKNETIF